MAEEIIIELALQGSEKSISRVAELENELKKLNERIKTEKTVSAEVKKEQIKLREEKNRLNKQIRENIKSFEISSVNVNELGKSYSDIQKANKTLKQEYKSLDPSIEGNSERMEELAKKIKENTDTLKEYDAALGENFRNVGNYKEAVTEALQESGLFGRELGIINKVQKTFTDVTDGAGKAVKTIKDDFSQFRGNILKGNKGLVSSVKNLKLFKFALASTGIGLLIIALGTVITLFKRFQPAIDLASKAMTILGSVVNEIVNRLGVLATAAVKVFKGDFKGAAEDAKKAVDNFGSAIVQAAENGAKIADLEVKLRKLRREVGLNVQALENQRDIAQLIADDNTRNFTLRQEQAEKVRKLNERIAQENLKLAKQELEATQLRIKNNKQDNELLDQQAEQLKAVREGELNLRLVQEENAKIQREIRNDAIEFQLDVLIDGFDNQKTLNERLIQNEKKTFDERRSILEATRQLGLESFNEQIKVIQSTTEAEINANDLLAEQDALRLAEKIKGLELGEALEKRLFEAIRERKIAIADFAELEQDLNEAEVESTRKTEQAKLDLEKQKNKDSLKDLEQTLIKERDLLLENENLTEEERQKIIFESEEKIKEIRKQSAQQQKDIETDTQQSRLETISNTEQRIGEIVQAFTNLFEAQKNRELAAAGDNAQKKEEIEKRFARRSQRIAIADTLIRGALAIMRIAADVPKVDFGASTIALIAAQSALTATQVAAIASQKFASGGMVHGNSHAQGGEKFAVGGRVVELEGGEAVINKRSTSMYKPLLSAINQAGGGKRFALGGVTPSAQLETNILTEGGIGQEIARQLSSIKVVNVVSDTTDKQISINNVESEAIF